MAEQETLGTVVDTTSFVSTFPQVEGIEISRDNILQTLETMIDGRGIRSVHIEGDTGSGKSVLLSQFAKSYKNRTLSVFAKRSSWFTYDPGILLQDLAAQMYWLVERQQPQFTEEITPEVFRALLYKLRTYSSRIGKPLILVLDGLAEIPEEQSDLKNQLISRLPLGLDYIKLLTSASPRECNLLSGVKEWLVPPFSTDETLKYFDGQLSTEQARVVHATCGGAPGFLSGIRRLLCSGISPDSLLAELPTNIPEVFALEWRSVDEGDSYLLEALALLAHDSNKHNLSGLSIISGAGTNGLRVSLANLRFINLPASDSGDVEFVSEPFRQFVAEKLAYLRESVIQKIIDRLILQEDSNESCSLLPLYLKQAGDSRKLLQYLSPDRLAKLLDSQHQISPVRQQILIGLETARDLNNYSETMRFAVQSSALWEYSGFTVSESEISARMELQNDASCIALAQAAVLTNDRLRLLAVVARKKRERGDTLEPELVSEIEALFERAEWKEFSSASLNDLAADLVYVRPDLAIHALERGTHSDPESSKRLDLALASASIAAAVSQDNALRDSSQRLRSGIKNPRFLSMFSALADILRGVGACEIVEKVTGLNAAKDQIYLLRQWSLHSTVDEGAGSVTSFALDVAIRATEYTPTATDFRELAETLRRISDPQELIDLIRRFDAQRASVELIGPTTDFQYLQLLLALGEAKVDKKAAANRIVDVYSSVDQIRDLAVRTACLARILDLLPLIDPDGSIRRREGIEDLVCQSFEAALGALLSSTADHSYATRDIISALIPRHVKMALRVALALNVASRRDDALALLVSSMLRVRDQELDLSELSSVLTSFYDPDDAETATCQVLERVANLKPASPIQKGVKAAIPFAAGLSLKFRDGERQVRACCAAILCVDRFDVPSVDGLKKSLIERMVQAWDRLDVDADRIALGFRVSARLATLDRKMAEEWLAKAESCRASNSISASSDPYRHCLLLISRSYMGLVMKHLDQPDDLAVLARLIDRIPSSMEQLVLWTDVALRILACGRLKEAQDIGVAHVQPLIAHYQSGTAERFRAIVVAMPVLFHTSKVTATDLMAELPPAWLNSAVNQVANYILKKRPSWDPYETRPHQAYDLTIDELYCLCDLASKATVDVTAYWIVSTIVASLRTKEARKTITGNQRSDVIIKLKEIRDTRFPTPNFISHPGYRVLASVDIAQLEKFQQRTWEAIISEVIAIPNIADRCLVLIEAAGSIAKNDDVWAISVLKDCQRYALDIPSVLDRAQRLEMMAREAYVIDRELARDFYTQALLMTAGNTAPEYESVRRDIIDSAHQISPELASSIASAMDDDQARRAKRGVSSRIELLDLRHRLMDHRSDEDELPEGANDRLAEASWALLGSLNSELIVPVKISHTRPYLERAADLPFGSAFAIYSYVIENALQRPQERSEEERSLRGLYRSLTGSAELFYFLAERGVAGIPAGQSTDETDRDQFCFVDADQKEKGVAFIEKWLAERTGSTITIHDPYLLPNDVAEILKMVLLVKPSLEVNLITSRIGLQRARILAPFGSQFRSAWTEASSQPAPVTRIIVVAVGSEGSALIHDRWWCSDESGLDFGTSFNSLGHDKGSKIRIMPKDEASQAAARLASITGMKLRYVEEKRVVYESVDL